MPSDYLKKDRWALVDGDLTFDTDGCERSGSRSHGSGTHTGTGTATRDTCAEPDPSNGQPEAIAALRDGARAPEVAQALASAAAERLFRFDLEVEFSAEVAETWLVGLSSSFGPAVAVLVAVLFLGERLRPIQWIGIVVLGAGMLAITVG